MNQSVHDFSAFAILITRLEDFILQLCDDGRDEGRLGVGKEGDGGDQGSTVEVDHVLMWVTMKNADGDYEKMKGRPKGRNLITSRSFVIVIMKELKVVVHYKYALYSVHSIRETPLISLEWKKRHLQFRPCIVFLQFFFSFSPTHIWPTSICLAEVQGLIRLISDQTQNFHIFGLFLCVVLCWQAWECLVVFYTMCKW